MIRSNPPETIISSLDLPYHPKLGPDVMTYTVAEVAHALRVSPSTVYRYKDRGLKMIQIGGDGGHTGVRHDDLLAYLDACAPLRARRSPRVLH
jgi:hypothetical protein